MDVATQPVISRSLNRWILPHIAATFSGGLLIYTGVRVLTEGPGGIMSGLLGALGGSLIFLVIALVTLPVGMALRALAGLLPVSELVGAALVGMCVSFYAMMILHPEVSPVISLDTHLVELFVLHAGTGIVCGMLWWVIEFRSTDPANSKPVEGT